MNDTATEHRPLPLAVDIEPVVICAAPPLGVLAFTGPDAEAFLQGQLSNDLKALAPGAVQASSYNSPKGRMLATLYLWRHGDDAFHALVAADLAETLRKRLSMYVLRAKLNVADLSVSSALFGVGGIAARDTVQEAFGAAPAPGQVLAVNDATLVGLPDGRLVVVGPATAADALRARLAAHVALVSADVFRWMGIRAGVPSIGAATQDLFVAQTANWDLLGGVSFQKGCYPGQEIVARTQYLGRLKERLHLFHVDAAPPLPATRLYGSIFGDQACGTVVDAAPAPHGGSDLLAVVQSSALDGTLALGAQDGPAMAQLPLPYAIPVPVAPDRPKL
jgi:tRNA-modifying protein YgfZ